MNAELAAVTEGNEPFPAELEALQAVEKAAADIQSAATRLQAAERELEKAEADLRMVREYRVRFPIFVLYNGVEKEETVQRAEKIKLVLERAVKLFNAQNPHTLSLYTTQGRELADDKTIQEEGVLPKEKLLLRPGAVKGGLKECLAFE